MNTNWPWPTSESAEIERVMLIYWNCAAELREEANRLLALASRLEARIPVSLK